tara:strand:- start:2146 stop:2265 length:120 start_codon:yes stop_codon:yes gene_type:complete
MNVFTVATHPEDGILRMGWNSVAGFDVDEAFEIIQKIEK